MVLFAVSTLLPLAILAAVVLYHIYKGASR